MHWLKEFKSWGKISDNGKSRLPSVVIMQRSLPAVSVLNSFRTAASIAFEIAGVLPVESPSKSGLIMPAMLRVGILRSNEPEL